MDKGIKPTRLWYLSGRKHIRDWVNDRLTAIKGYDGQQRTNYGVMKLNALVWGLTMSLLYSYGFLSPDKYSAFIKKTDAPNDCVKKCSVETPPQPCPDNKKK